MHTLREKQRRASVPQVVKAPLRDSGLLEDRSKLFQHVVAVERRSDAAAEYEVVMLPAASLKDLLLRLTFLVRRERQSAHCGDCEAASTAVCLWRLQPPRPRCSIQGVTNLQEPAIQVNIGPPERERFAFSKAHRDCHGEERFKPMPLGEVKKAPGVLWRKRIQPAVQMLGLFHVRGADLAQGLASPSALTNSQNRPPPGYDLNARNR